MKSDANNKRVLVLSFLGAITLIAVTLGATYAYFTAQGGGTGNIDTNVITGTTDNLSFSFGDLINIYATEENFGQGMGSISDSTTGQAILKANNTTNEAIATYNIYLIIEANDFVYTTEEQTPEIVLNVTDPNGNKVENITGLVHYENGFDITTRTGGFLIVPDYEISATDTQTVQDWNIEVTLVNLNSDQNANTNKTLTGRLYITQEQMSSYELTQINNIDTTTTYNSIDATLDITNGSASVSKYYYGIEKTSEALAYNNSIRKLSNTLASAEDVEYIESDTPNYEFSNLVANTEYTIYSYVIDENKIKSNVYSTNITTDEYELPTVYSVSHSVTLNSISLTVNASNGSNEIVKYMYSKDNGASWEESTSNTHTFNGLTDSTQYNIKVKVVDSEGAESTEYYEAITTEIYILPVVSSVNAETTWNSITLTPSGTNGTNSISRYEYSINGGIYQISNVFSNLTDNTNYTIRVKAIDTAGRESNVYETTVRTDAYRLPTISVSTSATSDSITVNVSATPGDGSIVSYHYSRDDGSNYQTSNSNSYIFGGLTSGTTYYLRIYVTDSNGRTSAVTGTSITTERGIFSNYIIEKLYTGTDGVNGLYYHDGLGTYGSLEAGDYSYRYVGANPNNYVCFGTDAATCPTDNLYRIVGVFGNQVKLIKYDYATTGLLGINGAYYNTYLGLVNMGLGWDTSYYKGNTDASSMGVYWWNNYTNTTTWSQSNLNTVNLNTNYLNNIGSIWSSKIANHSWKVGGNASVNITAVPVKSTYANEIVSPAANTTYSAKIGLMYVSDYGYAASPENWNTNMGSLNTDANRNNNWMFMGLQEWTITHWADYFYPISFIVSYIGNVNIGQVNGHSFVVRPTFYLESNVELISGSGTQTDPYRIA